MDLGERSNRFCPKLRHGYLVEDSNEAQQLASQYLQSYFLTPGGECFHNATVTGGKPSSEGPLALKRELRETSARLAVLETNLAQAEVEAETLTQNHRRDDCATGGAQHRKAPG